MTGSAPFGATRGPTVLWSRPGRKGKVHGLTDRVPAWKQIVLSLVVVAAAGAAWYEQDRLAGWLGFGGASERGVVATRAGVPVIVAPVQVAEDALVLEAVGTGRARRSVMLRVDSAGKVVEMAMRPGERYHEGEILLRLDDTEARLAVELAMTQREEVGRVRDRTERLADTGAVSTVRLREALTAAEIARIEFEQARETLGDRLLRAPFDGVAGFSEVEIGDRVDTSAAIASFDDRSVILVGFDLPEALIGRITPGMAVSATTPAVPGQRFEGKIAEIDSRIAAESRTVRVRVAIDNPDDVLRPGGSFTVRLELPGERYPVVPELALQFARGSLYVWRIQDGVAERVEVRMIRRRSGEVLVEGPLGATDLVVIEGTQRLAPGEDVEIVATDTGGAA